MAVVTINSKLADVSYDSRFKAWAKVIAKRTDVDLSKTNGYAIASSFVNWGKTVALAPGQFVVLAAESGSRARHEYRYALVTVDADDQPVDVTDRVDAAIAEATIPDAQRAKAANSVLYRMALYCALQFDAAMPDVERGHKEAAEVDVARKALAALTDEQRETLLAEFRPVATGGYRFGNR